MVRLFDICSEGVVLIDCSVVERGCIPTVLRECRVEVDADVALALPC